MAAKPPRHWQQNRRVAASEIWGWLALRACALHRSAEPVENDRHMATMPLYPLCPLPIPQFRRPAFPGPADPAIGLFRRERDPANGSAGRRRGAPGVGAFPARKKPGQASPGKPSEPEPGGSRANGSSGDQAPEWPQDHGSRLAGPRSSNAGSVRLYRGRYTAEARSVGVRCSTN
jgi:hypothetical protein